MDKRLFLLVGLLWCLPLVVGVGYAPVTIIGSVVDGGVPVDAVVSLQSFVDGEVFGESDPVRTEDGLFAASVSVPDPAVVDVQVMIVADGETFVEVVEDATSWGRYELVFDIADDTLRRPAPESSSSSSSSLPGEEFEDDLEVIRSGDDEESLADVIEKYDVIVEDRPALPVEESPAYVPAPALEESEDTFFRQYWEVFAVIMVVICFLIIRHEVRREH